MKITSYKCHPFIIQFGNNASKSGAKQPRGKQSVNRGKCKMSEFTHPRMCRDPRLVVPAPPFAPARARARARANSPERRRSPRLNRRDAIHCDSTRLPTHIAPASKYGKIRPSSSRHSREAAHPRDAYENETASPSRRVSRHFATKETGPIAAGSTSRTADCRRTSRLARKIDRRPRFPTDLRSVVLERARLLGSSRREVRGTNGTSTTRLLTRNVVNLVEVPRTT